MVAERVVDLVPDDDERSWSDPVKMKKTYSEKPADKRPVWVSGRTDRMRG